MIWMLLLFAGALNIGLYAMLHTPVNLIVGIFILMAVTIMELKK